jgi:radical SAM protein with 4Fe4S-binding SPASM domain
MQQILENLWRVGIPHVTIQVEPIFDPPMLLRAVERAAGLEMIVGVRGRGTELGHGTCIPDLVAAGLDHIEIYCFSHRDEIHDALGGGGDHERAVRALAVIQKFDICPVAQIALVRSTLATIEPTLASLAEHGLRDVHLFAIASTEAADAVAGVLLAHELPPAAQRIEKLAERLNLRLLWQPTLRFTPEEPLGEQACRGPRSSGDTAIHVEPDGSVFLARGPFRPAGNVVSDDWSVIEQSEVYQAYHRRVTSDTHCSTCPGLAICAADCPRDPEGWAEPECDWTQNSIVKNHEGNA